MQQSWLGLALPDGHLQGLRHQTCRHRGRTGPAHDFARKQIDHNGEIQPPFHGPESRDVTAPHAIGGGHRKLAVEYIGRNGPGMPTLGGLRTAPRAPGLQLRLAHECSCPKATHGIPRLLQGRTHPTRAIGATRGSMEALDLKQQRGVWVRPASSALHIPIIPTGTHL